MNKLGIQHPRWSRIALTLAFLGVASVSSAVTTVVVNQDLGTTQSIVGLTGFATTGANMVGMTVTAFFDDGTEVTGTWQAGSAGSGFASASDTSGDYSFLLEQSGDTFQQPWTLTNTSLTEIGITRLLIDGFPGDTVFDRTFGGSNGTNGSAEGKDFQTDYEIPGLDFTITALYQDQVAVSGFSPVGDLFRYLDITLGMQGGLFNFDDPMSFVADTDSVGLPPGQVPEPASLFLLGAGLVGVWLRRRS